MKIILKISLMCGLLGASGALLEARTYSPGSAMHKARSGDFSTAEKDQLLADIPQAWKIDNEELVEKIKAGDWNRDIRDNKRKMAREKKIKEYKKGREEAVRDDVKIGDDELEFISDEKVEIVPTKGDRGDFGDQLEKELKEKEKVNNLLEEYRKKEGKDLEGKYKAGDSVLLTLSGRLKNFFSNQYKQYASDDFKQIERSYVLQHPYIAIDVIEKAYTVKVNFKNLEDLINSYNAMVASIHNFEVAKDKDRANQIGTWGLATNDFLEKLKDYINLTSLSTFKIWGWDIADQLQKWLAARQTFIPQLRSANKYNEILSLLEKIKNDLPKEIK